MVMKTRWVSKLVLAALVLALSVGVMGLGANPALAAEKVFKVGLVTDVGGLNDRSFNHLAWVGTEQAKKLLGVQVGVVESKQMTDYVPNLSRFAQEGYDLVIGVGFLLHDAVEQVSQQYPNTHFLIIDDSITDRPNVVSALFNTEECGYLVGVMAGLMEKQKNDPRLNPQQVIGVVGGMKIPPVDSYIAGFLAGVKKVNPQAKVLVNYTNNFNDPASGKQMALSEIGQGADIVFHVAGGTGNGVIQACDEKKVYAIGVDADQNYLAPSTVMTSALKGVDVATFQVIKATKEGRFKSGDLYFNLKNGGVGYAKPIKAVPASILKEVERYRQEIIAGKITVPATLK